MKHAINDKLFVLCPSKSEAHGANRKTVGKMFENPFKKLLIHYVGCVSDVGY